MQKILEKRLALRAGDAADRAVSEKIGDVQTGGSL